MINLNGTDYRLCLLDTNAVSEMAKRPEILDQFLGWAEAAPPIFVPCFSLFTVMELRQKQEVYDEFVSRFGSIPCVIVKSHEQLLEEEVAAYPDPASIDPILVGFPGELGGDGKRLANMLETAFGTPDILARERYWNSGRDSIVEGVTALVANFLPEGAKYTRPEIRLFVEVAGFSQLAMRAQNFVELKVMEHEAVNIDAFPSVKASLYTVFHKFYVDRSRAPSRSDAFDIIISSATPYVEAVVTENHQAEVLRKTKRLDNFLNSLTIFTLRDFRDAV